jgi:glycosyltransferase involved in cell wall biosynthesis
MVKPRICYIAAPTGQMGGGMGRVKDYILQSGGDRYGRVKFELLDTRGSGRAMWSVPYTLLAVAKIWHAQLTGNLAGVHVNLGDRGSAARKGFVVVMARLVGAPVVLHLHAAELVEHYEKASPALKALIRLPFRMATCCVVLGKLWRDWLVNDLGVDPAKVEILYNGVPVPDRPRTPESFSSQGQRQILFLGNLMERKGVSDLLHAFALMPATPDWHATLVGGGEIERYKALANELKVTSRVTFAGWMEQAKVRELLRTADILTLPSYDEGLPLVILEALGSGTPVLTTPVGSIPEVLKDGTTALLVKPGDRKGLADKLTLAITDINLRKRLSEEGLRLFKEKFTHEVFIAQLFAIYRRHCGMQIEQIEKTVPLAAAS